MDLYLDTAFKINKVITTQYSTSFSLGIKTFSRKYRDAIYSIYGYVRLADEIIDSFHGYNKAELFSEFRKETQVSFARGISVNPVVHAFQLTVKRYNIDYKYIEAFLDSMEMDLDKSSYDRNIYDKYVYGSAEAVGLMCLHVFCEGDTGKFEMLKEPARMLGSAFQKVNFLRDIKSDIEERGRIYLPGVHSLEAASNESKQYLENEVEAEFSYALQGIKQLPNGVKLGVYLAYLYYYVLFRKIKGLDLAALLNQRVRVPNTIKFALLLKAIIMVRLLR